MQNGYILPFKPKKGEAFKLRFKNFHSFDSAYTVDPASINILKDNGAGVHTANSIVHTEDTENFEYAIDSLQLTADEMNANEIVIDIHYGSGASDKCFIIYTDGFTGFGSESGGGGGLALTDEVRAYDEFDRDGVSNVQQLFNALYKFMIKNKDRKV